MVALLGLAICPQRVCMATRAVHGSTRARLSAKGAEPHAPTLTLRGRPCARTSLSFVCPAFTAPVDLRWNGSKMAKHIGSICPHKSLAVCMLMTLLAQSLPHSMRPLACIILPMMYRRRKMMLSNMRVIFWGTIGRH